KWAVYPDLPGSEVTQPRSQELNYRPENAFTEGGFLKLRLNLEGATWTAGGVESKSNVPGDSVCLVVRAKGGVSTFNDNVLSAIWMQNRPLSQAGASDPNPETDIQEFIRSNQMHSALHTWTYNSTTQTFDHRGGTDENPPWMREGAAGADLVDSFHNYAMKRENNVLTFFLDGVEQYTMPLPTEYQNQFNWGRHMVLSLQGNPTGPPSDQLPLPVDFEVDFVHVFTP
ncbi:MAG: glycoside hydrolase family 16 protein, partial [Micromonosporaceae bacterium]